MGDAADDLYFSQFHGIGERDMPYGKKSYGKSSNNDKYLRLTGLWPSKNNDALFTGRVKADDVEALVEKFQEALDNEAPIVFSLWDNDEKKRSRKDPDFNLQCFVGDAEEMPRSRKDRDEEDEDKPRRKSSKRDERDEPEEDNDDENDEDQNSDDTDNEEEEEEKPRKKTSSKKAPAKKAGKSKNDW